ncbi:MAG: 5-formyltetrahydrofolate cyclo-ligase, partial [Bacillota bacterium]
FDDLTEGNYGILEPINSNFKLEPYFLDLIIVPGLVFSHKGFRIGYGGGFYDRFLARAKTKNSDPLKISFVYKEFIIDKIPTNQYDLPVDYIITEEKIINCKQFRGN